MSAQRGSISGMESEAVGACDESPILTSPAVWALVYALDEPVQVSLCIYFSLVHADMCNSHKSFLHLLMNCLALEGFGMVSRYLV